MRKKRILVMCLAVAMCGGCGKIERKIAEHDQRLTLVEDEVGVLTLENVEQTNAILRLRKGSRLSEPKLNGHGLSYGTPAERGEFYPPAPAGGGAAPAWMGGQQSSPDDIIVRGVPAGVKPPALIPWPTVNQQTGEQGWGMAAFPYQLQDTGGNTDLSMSPLQPNTTNQQTERRQSARPPDVVSPSAGPAPVIIHNHIHNYPPARDDTADDLSDIGVPVRSGSDDLKLLKLALMAGPPQAFRETYHVIQNWRQLRRGEHINEAAPGLMHVPIATDPGGAAFDIYWRRGVTAYAWFRRNN